MEIKLPVYFVKFSGVEISPGVDDQVQPRVAIFERYDDLAIYYAENHKKLKSLIVGKLVHDSQSLTPKLESLNTETLWKRAYELKVKDMEGMISLSPELKQQIDMVKRGGSV